MPGSAVARGAQGGARHRDAGRDQRAEQPHVGDRREPRRRGVRGRLLRRESRRAVAGQPRHLRPEGEHGQRLQPRRHLVEQRIGPGQGPGALDRQPLFRGAARAAASIGLQHSNPVDTDAAYEAGGSAAFGTAGDPMFNRAVGGVNVFGGGLGLYASGGRLVGGVGVSGDTSCADHYIAWRVRQALNLDFLAGVGGVSGDATRPGQHRLRHHRQPGWRQRRQQGRIRSPEVPQHGRSVDAARGPLTPRTRPAGAARRDRRVDRADPRRAGDRQRPVRAARRVPRHVQPPDRGRPRRRGARRDRRGAGAHPDASGAPLRRAGGGARHRLGLLRRDRQRRSGDPRRRARPLRRVRPDRLAVPARVARPAGRVGDRRAGARGADRRRRRRGVPVVPAGARRRARRRRAERGRDRLRPARRRGDHAARQSGRPLDGHVEPPRRAPAGARHPRPRRLRAPGPSRSSSGAAGRRPLRDALHGRRARRGRTRLRARDLAPAIRRWCGRRASRARIST